MGGKRTSASVTPIFGSSTTFLRIKDNAALSYATQNHEIVTALYVYNKIEFDGKREAQKLSLIHI